MKWRPKNQKVNKPMRCFFFFFLKDNSHRENFSSIYQGVGEEKTQINKILNERGHYKKTTEIQGS